MGIFNIKRRYKAKNKSKESTIIEGKSKNGFHFPFIFKISNKKKQNKKNKKNEDDKPIHEQGYYFVSYQKQMAISRAPSNLNNQDNMVQNPHYDAKTIEFIQSSINPFEEQINSRKRKIQVFSRPNSLEPQNLKKIHSNSNIEVPKTEASEEKTACISQVPDQLQTPTQISNIEVDSSLITYKPKHISTISQIGEILENEGFETTDSISEENEKEIISINTSFSKESSNLLNIEGQNSVEIINEDEIKPLNVIHTPSSTQATLGKDTSLSNTFSSDMIELNNSSLVDEVKSENIEKSNTTIITESSREKRKRSDSQNSQNSFQESSETYIKEKKIKKNKKRGSKDLNLVKINKKRMGIITRSCHPIIQDTSIVQGVKGPWKIVETTTMTAGIATSPEIIHQTFGSTKITQTNHMIIHSPSLPSLKNTTLINQKLIARHQIVSDSLIEEVNSVQKKRSSNSLDDQSSKSVQDSNNGNCSNNYKDGESKEINCFYDLDSLTKKKSNPKLFLQNIKNKSLKAVFKQDSKKLNQKDEKKLSKMTVHEIKFPSLQSQIISTSINSESINANSNITPATNITTNINSHNDIPNQISSNIMTTIDFNNLNDSNSLFLDTTNRNILDSKSNLSSENQSNIKDEAPNESLISNSFTFIKYHLNKPSYLEDEQSKITTDSHWSSDVTMKARYNITTDHNNEQKEISSYRLPFVRNSSLHCIRKLSKADIQDEPTINKKEESIIDIKNESITSIKDKLNGQLNTQNNLSRNSNSEKKKSCSEDIKPLLDKARKRKNIQRRKQWQKKFENIESSGNITKNDGNPHNDTFSNCDNSNTSFDKTNKGNSENLNCEQNDSFYDNYYLGLSYSNNEKSMEQQSSKVKKIKDNKNKNVSYSINNKQTKIVEKSEESIMIDTTFTSLEFKDTVISNVENDITSMNQSNKTKTYKSLLNLNGKMSSLPTFHQTQPKLIDVPENSSMIKAYAMKDYDISIDERYFDVSMLTPKTNHSTAGSTAANDTMNSINNIPQNQIIPQPQKSNIQIIDTKCSEKTSTYNYLPIELLEPDDSTNITNFQIHTCKDSVLSPLIPCIACSNENKWKNKNLTTKFSDQIKKWMLTLTHSKKGNERSMVYTSSATLTVPIYFGDQLASPKDQDRHHHHHSNDFSRKITSNIRGSRKLKSPNLSSSFISPNKSMQYSLQLPDCSLSSLHPVIETKRSNSEILPIANDINRKNSSVFIKKFDKTASNKHILPRSKRTVSLLYKLKPQEQFVKDQIISIVKSNYETKNKMQQNLHKNITYTTNNVLEKDSYLQYDNDPQISKKKVKEYEKCINNKVLVNDGYNESIFSNPITPELKPSEMNDEYYSLKSKASNLSISISTTTSSYSVPIQQITTSTLPIQSTNSFKRHSKTFNSLYKDVCVLGLSIDRLAERYSSSFNKKN